MFFTLFFLLASLVGFTGFLAALGFWRRESGGSPRWLVSCRGVGTLCVLAGGAGLAAGTLYKAFRLTGYWSAQPFLYDYPVVTAHPKKSRSCLAFGMLC